MVERVTPAVFTIPVHRSFADALVNGLIAMFGRDRMELARGVILVPNNRAARAITDAFVRRAEGGLLLPRLVPVGDVGEEALGVALDPADAEPVPPAVDPLQRRFILARLIQEERAIARSPVDAAEALRLATELAATLDQLLAEEIAPSRLRDLQVAQELSVHWQKSLDLFGVLLDRWPDELKRIGRIDLVTRRNILLRRAAEQWAVSPPPGFVVAAGITSSAKLVMNLVRAVSRMERGMVVFPGIDLASPDEEWEAISEKAIESHPQHHLRTVLDGIRVARSDVKRWRWGDGRERLAVRARAVSNAFAPAQFTAKWNILPPQQVRLKGVTNAVFATPADEAQGIAIALRGALEEAGKTAALITPDRVLAERVVAHLKRWGIDADDSAGRALSETPSGTLILAVATAAVERFAPVALLALVKHPLVMTEARADWLDGARDLDLAIRGPRPAPGLVGLSAFLTGDEERTKSRRTRANIWWNDVTPLFEPLETAFGEPHPTLASLVEAVRVCVQAVAGDNAWAGPAGRAAADLFDALAANSGEGPRDFDADALVPLLRQLMSEIAVRPPQGGHPRISIWGLLEARLQQADLLVLGGLNEGVWPASPSPDPWLAPRVRIELGLGGLERRVGLAAHDLATALGGREVLVTRARRDARSPTIASRFWLRLDAMTGGIEANTKLVRLAAAIDAPQARAALTKRPAPTPPAAIRPRRISVTDVDRLKADPYAFYAKAMLKLPVLDAVDADPGPAWRGTAVHAVLDKWAKNDGFDPGKLRGRVTELLNDAGTHPLLRALWQPRLAEAIDWIAVTIAEDRSKGRTVIASEIRGEAEIAGVTLTGIADRVDRIDGALAVVDYKTGKAPSPKAVAAGFSMQLGLLGLIAERGGFAGVTGTAGVFEYWSLASDGKGGFGKVTSPVGGRASIAPEDFVRVSAGQFSEAAANWLTGNAPFTAKLVPEYATYEDYDQLMRRDEWYGREDVA
ncbi:MAG: double-strand break repair protein AddB [Sphingomonadales bacterium]|nr:double-strand break repair protein AddB [Sphingomonadales bacterium]